MSLKNNKLSDEVINILLDFSIIQNKGSLVTEYVEKISASILKLEIIKAKEVIDFLKKAQSASGNFSDVYYKDDKDLNVYNFATFELRKENTQKIHSLPEKTYNILNWKNEIKTELPTVKILENIWKILNSLVDKLSNKK